MGLGAGRYQASINKKDKRKLIGQAVSHLEEKKHLAHAHSLALQGAWTKWQDISSPFDLSWKNLIYGPGPRLIVFVLNASINSLPAPDILRIMNYRQDDSCKLCGHKQCSLMHILSWCHIALKQKRYTFRHDSVLSTLKPVLLELIQKHNSKSQVQIGSFRNQN